MLRYILFSGVLLFSPLAAQAEIVMVVHPSNPITHLSAQDIQSIYLFKKVTWANGLHIAPMHLRAQDLLRKTFSKKWLEKSLGEMETFYLMRALSGRGQPPVIFSNTEEVKAALQNSKGGIAYIDSKDLDDSVKVVLVEGTGSRR